MEKRLEDLKVALVADWLTTIGGAEKVLKILHEMFPEAPIYTSQYSPDDIDWFKSADVRTGWLQKLPRAFRKFLPVLRMYYFSHLDLSAYDLVISSTGAEAKAVSTSETQVNISYMHAPTQYYWNLYDQYIKDPGFGILDPIVRVFLKLSVGRLRKSDYRYAQIPDLVVANSTYIAEQIYKFYDRDSHIVFPPVDTEKFSLEVKKDDYFIITSRHVPWKRVDLAIEAVLQTGDKLVVVGSGTETESLKELAKNSSIDGQIHFVPTISDANDLAKLVSKAKGFIFPSLEPFGIAPIEALATGTPVLAYRAGGALDFITPENGIFFDEQSVEAVVSAIGEFKARKFDAKAVSISALRFSDAHFKDGMLKEIVETFREKGVKLTDISD